MHANAHVHVWYAWLDRTPEETRQLSETLSIEEQERADRFRFQQDHDRFIVRRGILRAILSRYLGNEPARVQFKTSPYGKLALSNPLPPVDTGRAANAALNQFSSLCFNLSHSQGVALYAIAPGREVGIDVEIIRPNFDYLAVARRFFSPHEQAALGALPPAQQARAFFACWTRKEAYIKAHGEGLSLPLEQFDVSLAPGEGARLLATRHDPDDIHRWEMCNLELDFKPGQDFKPELDFKPLYAAALVVECHPTDEIQISYWTI